MTDPEATGTAGQPPPFDTSVAHPARVHDYLLGGKDHYEADRVAAKEIIAISPSVRPTVRANRAFLRRAVQYLAGEAGIRQFLDIGTGLPTAEDAHQIAQAIAPESRVVYVDNDHCNSGCTHECRAPVWLRQELRDLPR